ncbi:hypothetical protein BRC93_15340 [Halobacteriales archaeon QS_5_70_15]|nr:MAG: hypothetical protein BRC93_15340 [Halobacteriales archaeon QS_5_70_15]
MVKSVEDGTGARGHVVGGTPEGERGPVPPAVRVPLSPSGVATAITHAASACPSTGPERSDPSNRGHPPPVRFGEERIPGSVAERTPKTGIGLRVPANYGALYATAPLAYYLGATVTVDEDATAPRLTAPPDVDRRLPADDGLAGRAARLLRSVFHLDCLARRDDAPDAGVPGLDFEAYAGRPMAGRLAAVLRGPLDGLGGRLPEWQLSTYVAPEPSHARALPHLLDAMSLIYPPSASELDGKGLLKRSLDDFFRGEVATADRLDPDLGPGIAHAWLADGIPITASKTTVRAYENRLDHGTRPADGLRIDVVINDREMGSEAAVADIYRRRAADLPVEVAVHESLTRRELRRVFESPTDFVHYVGHCEVEGLRCPDGHLAARTVEVGARTFFLNACGSYAEGLALVENGAAAGGVTLTRVLDKQAATVGTGFACLLVNGLGFERALSLARRQIMMGSDYAVVGDGTYALAPSRDPAVCHVSGGPEAYEIRWEVVDARATGRTYESPFDGEHYPFGTAATARLSAGELRAFLADRDVPVVAEGTVRPAAEIAAELGER